MCVCVKGLLHVFVCPQAFVPAETLQSCFLSYYEGGGESDLFLGTAVDDDGLELQLDLASAGSSVLKFSDNVHALLVRDLTKDDMLAIQPRGNDGGDEELRAVAVSSSLSVLFFVQTFLGGERSCFYCLTCWVPRWPWTKDQAWSAAA